MRFDEVDIECTQAAALEHRSHQIGLALAAGYGDASLACSVGVDAGGANHGVDVVSISQCACQRLDQQDGAAFGAHVAVAGGIKRAAAAVGRQHRRFGEAHERVRMQQQVDAAHQRHRRLSRAQTVARVMQRHQR